mgnify:CR=1 FL=1
MKKSKIITIILIVAFVIIAAVGVITIKNENDLKEQKENLVVELQALDELMNSENIEFDKVKEKLNTTVTEGEYAKVEKAAKAYYKDSLESFEKIMNLIEDEKIPTLLTADVYKKDGPKFKESRKYISNLKSSLIAEKDRFLEFLKEEKIMSYIEKENVSEEYKEFYKQYLVSGLNYEEEKKDIEKAVGIITTLLDGTVDIYDFLEENKKEWKIDGGQILFSSNKLVTKYNELLTNCIPNV